MGIFPGCCVTNGPWPCPFAASALLTALFCSDGPPVRAGNLTGRSAGGSAAAGWPSAICATPAARVALAGVGLLCSQSGSWPDPCAWASWSAALRVHGRRFASLAHSIPPLDGFARPMLAWFCGPDLWSPGSGSWSVLLRASGCGVAGPAVAPCLALSPRPLCGPLTGARRLAVGIAAGRLKGC